MQPLVARIFGLARLKLEVAGGSGSSIDLSYLTDTQARQLRNHLLAAAAGLEYETPQAPEAPERPVAEVPVERLVASLLLDGGVLTGAVVTAAAIALGLALAGVSAATGVVPLAIGLVTFVWRRFASAFGFTVKVSPDGLRLRHGLLEHRAQTVPPGRVQAVRLTQPLLWRIPGWWRVVVNVAGYAGRADNQHTENELLPVGTREQAIAPARAGRARPRGRAGRGRARGRPGRAGRRQPPARTAICRPRRRPSGSIRSPGGGSACG